MLVRLGFVICLWSCAAATAASVQGEGAPQPATQEPRETETQVPDAQAPDPQTPDDTQGPRPEDILPAVSALVDSIDQTQKDLEAALASPETDPAAVEVLRDELARLRQDFDSLITGISVEELGGERLPKSLQEDLEELVRPLLQQLKAATEEPRRIERLQTDVQDTTRRAKRADIAIANIRELQQRVDADSEVGKALDDAYRHWQRRKSDAINSRTVAQAQLDQIARERKPILESVQDWTGRFFRSSGLHLILAILAVVCVFLGLRFLGRRVTRSTKAERRERPFYFRVVRVAFHLVSVLAAVAAGLVVLYATGDWALLSIAILFLLGIAWVAKTALPRMVEELRMLLNLGSVREHERIVFEGLPWRVESLNLYTLLVNPALSGGRIRLPIRDLIGRYSRPVHDKEAWFPSEEGDWVKLTDGTRGKVIRQTPEMVQLVKLGGSRVTYPTSEFLEQCPENLSANFRVLVTFGVDYEHQPTCTTEIPEIMQVHLKKSLAAAVGDDNLVSVKVEFASAGASSLDYAVLADFDGDVAARSAALERLIQKELVDVCNAQGWVIPFTQITVHQAS